CRSDDRRPPDRRDAPATAGAGAAEVGPGKLRACLAGAECAACTGRAGTTYAGSGCGCPPGWSGACGRRWWRTRSSATAGARIPSRRRAWCRAATGARGDPDSDPRPDSDPVSAAEPGRAGDRGDWCDGAGDRCDRADRGDWCDRARDWCDRAGDRCDRPDRCDWCDWAGDWCDWAGDWCDRAGERTDRCDRLEGSDRGGRTHGSDAPNPADNRQRKLIANCFHRGQPTAFLLSRGGRPSPLPGSRVADCGAGVEAAYA
ncbi:MAG: hypothetical protein QOK12_1793, partial [Mycobacterium sp.]|nr:hypothetical protein [Mycobacterium sp.]